MEMDTMKGWLGEWATKLLAWLASSSIPFALLRCLVF